MKLLRFLLLALACVGVVAQARPAAYGSSYGRLPGYPLELKSFMGCPMSGDARDRRQMEVNLLKNRYLLPPAAAVDTTVTLEDLMTPALSEAGRWSMESGAVVEGFVVAVRMDHPSDANCRRQDEPGRDTILELAPFRNAPPEDRLFAVVTPRAKLIAAQGGEDYSTEGLRRLVGARVQVTGWLFYDARDAWKTGDNFDQEAPRRASAWEIHPALVIVPLRVR